MTVAGVATSHTKKLVKFTLSIIRPRFNSSKCKTAAKMAVARIKLLRNKREVVVRQMRRDIALLLQSGQDSTARVRVEHVIREQNVLAANEFVELFCELIVSRLTIIAKRKECPADLKEGISSLIFAAPRCSEIPELIAIRDIFEKKYGKDFVSAATDLRPSCGVNRMLIDKLSVRTPSGEVKLKVLKEIAKEHQIDWDTAESEEELLKHPEELIEGPQTFVSASSLPVKPAQNNPVEPNKPFARPTNEGEMRNMHFQDSTSAAEAAAEAAKQAIAAANAAAFLANKGNPASQAPFHGLNASGIHHTFSPFSGDSRSLSMPNNAESNNNASGRMYESHHYGSFHQENNKTGSLMMDNEHTYRRHNHNETRPVLTDCDNLYRRHSYNDTRPVQMDNQNASRRNSCNSLSPHSDIKFDESDYNSSSPHSDIKFDESDYPPPERPPPPAPSSHGNQDKVHRAHPKLPDYDALTARFEALKFHKSRT